MSNFSGALVTIGERGDAGTRARSDHVGDIVAAHGLTALAEA